MRIICTSCFKWPKRIRTYRFLWASLGHMLVMATLATPTKTFRISRIMQVAGGWGFEAIRSGGCISKCLFTRIPSADFQKFLRQKGCNLLLVVRIEKIWMDFFDTFSLYSSWWVSKIPRLLPSPLSIRKPHFEGELQCFMTGQPTPGLLTIGFAYQYPYFWWGGHVASHDLRTATIALWKSGMSLVVRWKLRLGPKTTSIFQSMLFEP